MKKLIIIMVIATISTTSFAQIGVQVGATVASIKAEDFDGVDKSSKIGLTLGVFTNVPLSTNITFRPGLNFTQKGGKFEDSGEKYAFGFNYLELPLDLIYKAPGGFFFGLGPTLSYGLSGKLKATIAGVTDEESLDFGSDENKDHLKAFEFSGNLLAGYQLANGIFFSLNYNMGFSNISFDSDESFKNNYFGIRIGKTFGTAKK